MKCDDCDATKPGLEGQVPRVSTNEPVPQWHTVGMDVGEFSFLNNHQCKLKFLLMMDKSSKIAVAPVMSKHGLKENYEPKSSTIIAAVSDRWLMDKPRPSQFQIDEGSCFTSAEFTDFCSSVNILQEDIAGQAPWMNSVLESTIKVIKRTMGRITAENPDLMPETVLALAVMAHNNNEEVRGFTPFQWAYGKACEKCEFAEKHLTGIDDPAMG